MPPLEEMDLHQEAVRWNKTGVDRYNNPILGTPTEIPVRWVSSRTQSVGSDGNPIALDAQVTTTELLAEGTILWEGKLENWNPSLKNELMEVATIKKTPSINARFVRYEYGLRKFRQKLS